MSVDDINRRKVLLNMWVRVRFQDGTVKNLKVVHNPKLIEGIVSAKSPVGSALLGALVNEKRIYNVRGKTGKFTVLDIVG